MRFTVENLELKTADSGVFSDFSAVFESPGWFHFKVRENKVGYRLLATLASFYRPSSGDIIWQEQSIYSQLDQYRSSLRFFTAGAHLFDYFTVRQSLDLYSHLFNLDGTVDLEIYGELDRNRKLYTLSPEEEIRLKLATFLPGGRQILFFVDPFQSLEGPEFINIQNCFKKISHENIIVFTSGSQKIPAADEVYDIATL
ncbi:MAG: hypothetical protein ACLFN5_00935 [bacterium]